MLVDEIVELNRELSNDAPEHEAMFFAEKTREAENRILLALQQFPDDPDIIQVEARFREEIDQEDRALRALEKALRLNPRGSGAAIRVARIYRSRDRANDALKVLSEALVSSPDDKAVNSEIARHHLVEHTGDDDLIESHLRRSYSTGDGNYEGRFDLAQFLFVRGESARAAALFDEIDAKAPPTFRPVANRENHFTKRISEQAGYVQSISGHMFFIRAGGYPKEILSYKYSISHGDFEDLSVGSNLRFQIRFNRKGPVAVSVTII
jgi:tetratricopeptide (TPR) repeat protein